MKVGDKVTWTHIYEKGDVVTMTTKRGEIISLHAEGVFAVVQYGLNHRRVDVPVCDLRLLEERTGLTDLVNAIVVAARREQE